MFACDEVYLIRFMFACDEVYLISFMFACDEVYLISFMFAYDEVYLISFMFALMPLSTIFQLNRGGQFCWSRKPEYLEKTTDLLQVTDKFYRIKCCIKYRYTLP
jgi:hypothetical protein